jgi:type I restriction enzyme M protein
MNLLLHGMGPVIDEEGELPVITDDSLNKHPGVFFNVTLTNPPFGKKSSITVLSELEERDRQELSIVRPDFIASTSNKQLNFLQHIYATLAVGGRAAVVVPDNVLFEGGPGETVRRRLLEDCEVHTLLRLPPGIFYAQGIKTNVLFFDRKKPANGAATKKLWVYDLRTDMHFTMRTNRLENSDLEDFVRCYKPGKRQARKATWSENNLNGRWRAYTFDEIVRRDKCNLDIFWSKDTLADLNSEIDPAEIASEIIDDLQAAVFQLSEIASDLSGID